jgi:hypothetical protein
MKPPAELADLAQACNALWLATLSLMTAFMAHTAPAHRLLLARRIARNLSTLSEQECFAAADRSRFTQLCRRWNDRADRLSPEGRRPRGGLAFLRRLLPR